MTFWLENETISLQEIVVKFRTWHLDTFQSSWINLEQNHFGIGTGFEIKFATNLVRICGKCTQL